jgi:phosphate transport system substrate-binding protein
MTTRPIARRTAAGMLGAALALPALRTAAAVEPIRLAGATTLLPVVTDAANLFRERFGRWNRVDAALPDAEIVIYSSGGGSSAGVRGALDGTAQIGMVARDLRPQEIERLGDHEAQAIGIDGIVIAAHRDNPLLRARPDLTSAEVARIFAGEVTHYNQISPELPAQTIVLLIRDASGGSTVMVQQMIMGERKFARGALQMPSIGTQVRRLEQNPAAIAYTSAGVVLASETVGAFSLDGVAPTQSNLADRSYRLSRPLLLVSRAANRTPEVRAFLDFMLGPEGQSVVARHDFVPVRGPLPVPS